MRWYGCANEYKEYSGFEDYVEEWRNVVDFQDGDESIEPVGERRPVA